MLNWLGREPVLTHGVIMAALNLVGAFGFDLSVEQLAAVNTFVLAALSFLVRETVTPLTQPRNSLGEDLTTD